ncbi:MAG: PAS domain-containing protein, partial [Deltaproteobacteria bacterium]|nr:PAS domain-containing protein [Deltaproteobacteria bacterium]
MAFGASCRARNLDSGAAALRRTCALGSRIASLLRSALSKSHFRSTTMREVSALPGEADEPPRGPPGAPFVVGIRAGSADAVDRFLATIGADSGMSFVVVGDPGAALGRDRVARHTPMPVVPVEGATELEPDRVYLVADGSAVTITAGVLHPDRTRAATDAPADTFFRALADDQHENAAFVVMGAASPGSPGLAAARRHGGLVLIEAPVAGDPGGPTDEVVRPEQMPLRLVEAARRRGPRPDDAALLAAVAPLCAAIALHTGDDFSHYKATTLVRRIERRLAALRLASVEPYVARVRTDPDEARALVRELMVSVTQFFREPEALALAVREALAAHASVAPPTGPIRIWVPGCATGEEAYSIAMLAREALGDTGGALQLFASDIDAAALDVARAGWYPIAIAERVSPARLARFFARDGDGYRVTKALREDCSFAVHNVLRDPPFARLALVSCRNLFIYLELTLQAELLPLFHYALRPGGVLVLGAAETVSGAPDLFDTIDAMRRVYQRREQAHRLSLRAPLEASQARGRIGLAPRAPASGPVARALERALLDEHAPPGAVITHAGAVVYLCGRTEPYLDPPHGQVPFDLFAMTKPMLRHELRNALAQAIASGAEVATRDLLVPGAGVVRLRVRPMRELGAGADLYLVVFQAQPRAAAATTADPEAPLVETLERELDATRAQWRGTLHELETANEELRASNEELQAVNEELQTSREELQSTNEELTTLNTELAQRVAALDAAHDDLHNLFDATHIAVVLLDRAQRIRRFSPAARDLFRLIATDVGRPLADIAPRFTPVDLEAAVADVLATLAPRELAVHRPDGDARYQLRVLPYRSLSGEVDGVVVTFVDVTLLERAERRARHRAEELERVMDALPAMVFFTDDPHAAVVTGNAASARQLRARDGAPLPLGLASPAGGFRIFHDGVELDREQLAITRAARGESVRDFEIEIRFDDGTVRNMLGNAEPLRDDAGQPRGAVGAFVDITARIRAEQEQRAGEERYRTLAATAIDLIARYDRDHRYLYVNPALAARLGKRLDEIVGRSTAEIGRPSAWSEHLGEVFATGQGMRVDWFGTDGRWYDVQLSPELEGDRVASVVTVARDITEQKVAEDALRGSEQRYAAIFATAPFGLAVTRARDGIILAVNPAFARIFERGAEDIVGQTSIALGISEPAVRDQMMAELASTGVVRGFVSRRRMPSGRERALSISIDLVTVDGERLTISSIEDITERVAAEAAAQAAQRETEVQRAQLEAVIESVQDGIVVLDPAGRVVLVNSAEAQHYDLPGPPHAVDLAMLVGRYELSTPDGEVVPPEQWPAARVLRGESIVDVELRVRWDAQPMPRDVSFSGQPIRDAQGTPALIVIVTRDISERKRREVEHARLQADLAQAQKMEAVGTLAGG